MSCWLPPVALPYVLLVICLGLLWPRDPAAVGGCKPFHFRLLCAHATRTVGWICLCSSRRSGQMRVVFVFVRQSAKHWLG